MISEKLEQTKNMVKEQVEIRKTARRNKERESENVIKASQDAFDFV